MIKSPSMGVNCQAKKVIPRCQTKKSNLNVKPDTPQCRARNFTIENSTPRRRARKFTIENSTPQCRAINFTIENSTPGRWAKKITFFAAICCFNSPEHMFKSAKGLSENIKRHRLALNRLISSTTTKNEKPGFEYFFFNIYFESGLLTLGCFFDAFKDNAASSQVEQVGHYISENRHQD